MESMRAIDFHPGARSDFDESFDWYAHRSSPAAAAFASAVDGALERISADPARFAQVDAMHRECILSGFPFRLILREEADRVVIVAVAHAKRRPDYWRRRNQSQD